MIAVAVVADLVALARIYDVAQAASVFRWFLPSYAASMLLWIVPLVIAAWLSTLPANLRFGSRLR